MREATVIIPNLNGRAYLKGCLSSLQEQSTDDFEILLIDNGSTDDSVAYVETHYPQVRIHKFKKNTGFCHAVNEGIRRSSSPYVILLNNDVVCDRDFVRQLLEGIRRRPGCFSCGALMMQLYAPEKIDDAGDYYCALGWAFARGKGRSAECFQKETRIFAACAGAAIYRRSVLERIGLFDEKHFAYLEDIDIGYRAKIAGYENWLIPSSVVYHAGSGTSGSVYNEFKVAHTSRNSVYLIYKNMPWFQILLNAPFLLSGFLIKTVFFARKGFFGQYVKGLATGLGMCEKKNKVPFRLRNLGRYAGIQLELWVNMVRRLTSDMR